MAYALSFVEGDMPVHAICNHNLLSWSAFNIVDTINYMDVMVKSLLGVLIADEIYLLVP